MIWLTKLFRSRPRAAGSALRFRLGAESLEGRDVPSVVTPGISLTETAGPNCYTSGGTATYTYTVTNTGNVPLVNVSLTDDNGTPANMADDLTIQPGVTVPVSDNGGPPALATTLGVGHTWTFSITAPLPVVTVETNITHTAVVTAGASELLATVTATTTAGVCVDVPTPPTPISHGDTATIGFWHNKNGQALINSLNGGPTATNLATWLTSTFPDLYAGYNLKTNADVAKLFMTFFNVTGAKTNAQILGGALAAYVTDSGLAGTAAAQYGFNVSPTGTGAKTYNVGSLGTAIGLQNNTSYTVFQLLQAADAQKAAGTFNANAFNSIFDGINQGGDIS